jgi:very-short-patch-repair endonuclease
MRGADTSTTGRSRNLRRAMTDAERKFWRIVRNRGLEGYKFVRQEPVGPYYADFACRELRILVEIDGSQHRDNLRDRVRDKYLADAGYIVVRYWNNDVLSNIEGVAEDLSRVINERKAPHPATALRSADLSP